MSQNTAINATKLLTDRGLTVGRDAPLAVADDPSAVWLVLCEIRNELTAIRQTLARASNTYVTPAKEL